jgi:nitrilase
MKVAAIQMTSTRDVQANLREADRLLADAARQGAKLAVLPENFSFLGATDADRVAARRFETDLRSTSRTWRGATVWPSAARFRSGRRRPRVVGRCSGLTARAHYDKIHLFDVDIFGNAAERYAESATTLAGTRVVTAATPVGRIGMTVCYDIRFPALFHRLSVLGTDILVIPAAFTVPTGEVHWLPLLTARAVESLAYVVAAGQWGEHAGGRKTYGHSLVLGPWGELLGELPSGPGVVCVELDMIRLAELRQRFPTVQHRREL